MLKDWGTMIFVRFKFQFGSLLRLEKLCFFLLFTFTITKNVDL